MGQETRKSRDRRLREGYYQSVFTGSGIDIGCGDDPVTPDCRHWDREQGDAQLLPGVQSAQFDWIYSSHCLEHLVDPAAALQRWWEALKPGGAMLIVVPDEDLYEQGCWPSRFNPEHRWTFTVHKTESWSPVSVNLADLVSALPGHRLGWLRTCDYGYDHSGGVWDRTSGPAEAHIEGWYGKSAIGVQVLTPVHDLLRALPNKLGEGWDWFEAPKCRWMTEDPLMAGGSPAMRCMLME